MTPVRQLLITKDGSHTIELLPGEETFHSRHGALQESLHVYLEEGWEKINKKIGEPVSLLEVGLGTGLNALLTLIRAEEKKIPVVYEALETDPLPSDLYEALNYCDILQRPDLKSLFIRFHTCKWEVPVPITPDFTLIKRKVPLLEFEPQKSYHLVYYDAFAPRSQAELWEQQAFRIVFSAMAKEGILVTYCSKSVVRKAMQEAGFTVTKPPGPWGKREILRAIKP